MKKGKQKIESKEWWRMKGKTKKIRYYQPQFITTRNSWKILLLFALDSIMCAAASYMNVFFL